METVHVEHLAPSRSVSEASVADDRPGGRPVAAPKVQSRTHIWTKLFYGSGSLAFGVKDNGFSVLLLLYYNQVLGLPAKVAGAVVALALVVDSLIDPLIGYISDNFHSRWGRRHPFMYVAAAPAALSYLLLWNPPTHIGQGGLTIYLFVVAVLVRSFITLYEIPSSALGPELSGDYDERTSYMSFRYLFGWVGGVTMYVLAFALFLRPDRTHAVGQLNPAGYHNYGLAAAAVMFISILASSLGTHSAIPRLQKPPPRKRLPWTTAIKEIGGVLSNPSAVALLGAGVIGGLSAGIAFAMGVYFNTYFWQLPSSVIATLGLSSYFSAFGALMLAPALSRRLGKKEAAIAVALVSILLAPITLVLRIIGFFPANGSPWLLPLLFLSSVVVVGLGIIPPILVSSMISDVVEDNQLKSGRRSEGVLFAANAFLLKCVSGLGLLGASLILSVVRFPEKAAPGHVPMSTLTHLALLYAGTVAVLNLIAVGFIAGHRITRQKHAENLRRLEAIAELASGDDPRLHIPAPQ